MILYHGTSDGFLDDNIKKQGIVPRSVTGNNNFCSANVSSNENMVYMTNNFDRAFLYGCMSAVINDHSQPVVLRIDANNLNKDALRIDENFISMEECGAFTVSQDTRREQVERAFHDKRWEESLTTVGMCATVDPVRKFDIGLFKTKKNPLAFPSIMRLDKKEDRSAAVKHLITMFKFVSDKETFGFFDSEKGKWFLFTDFIYNSKDQTISHTGYLLS